MECKDMANPPMTTADSVRLWAQVPTLAHALGYDDEAEFDLYVAIENRRQLLVCPFGPLTKVEQATVDAYEAHMIEAEEEHRAQEAAGGRTICPQCGQRSVVHGTAVTLGYAGHPGAEYSGTEQCERCDYKDLA